MIVDSRACARTRWCRSRRRRVMRVATPRAIPIKTKTSMKCPRRISASPSPIGRRETPTRISTNKLPQMTSLIMTERTLINLMANKTEAGAEAEGRPPSAQDWGWTRSKKWTWLETKRSSQRIVRKAIEIASLKNANRGRTSMWHSAKRTSLKQRTRCSGRRSIINSSMTHSIWRSTCSRKWGGRRRISRST